MSHMVVCLISVFGSVSGQISITRSRGVTVSTLDPESSDRGSNPRETFCMCAHDSTVCADLHRVDLLAEKMQTRHMGRMARAWIVPV